MRIIVSLLVLVASGASAQSTSSVQYLANEGVMFTHAERKVLFDPLFDNGYDRYQLLPTAMRTAIMAGVAPFDDVDAVFVSHYHGDHFSAADIVSLLRRQNKVRLYAPMQAVIAMRELATADDGELFERVVGLDLDYGDAPVTMHFGDIRIEAVHIPHSGWPTARTDVQNIAFRITLDDAGTVVHLGDADARIVHFANDAKFWGSQQTDLALPPYWFFASDDGNAILEDRINANVSIGIHVPDSFSNADEIPAEYRGRNLFTKPGEGRTVSN